MYTNEHAGYLQITNCILISLRIINHSGNEVTIHTTQYATREPVSDQKRVPFPVAFKGNTTIGFVIALKSVTKLTLEAH